MYQFFTEIKNNFLTGYTTTKLENEDLKFSNHS